MKSIRVFLLLYAGFCWAGLEIDFRAEMERLSVGKGEARDSSSFFMKYKASNDDAYINIIQFLSLFNSGRYKEALEVGEKNTKICTPVCIGWDTHGFSEKEAGKYSRIFYMRFLGVLLELKDWERLKVYGEYLTSKNFYDLQTNLLVFDLAFRGGMKSKDYKFSEKILREMKGIYKGKVFDYYYNYNMAAICSIRGDYGGASKFLYLIADADGLKDSINSDKDFLKYRDTEGYLKLIDHIDSRSPDL